MRSTGIVRKVDELGRIVIPMELRRTLKIEDKDPIEIFVDEDKVVLKKYKANMTCDITGEVSESNVPLFDGKLTVSPEGAARLLEELQKLNRKGV